MRTVAPLLLSAAVAACLMAACSGPAEPPAAATGDAAPTEGGAATDAGEDAAQDNAGVTMRYRCDAGTEVTVLADGTAQVALPDGQQVVVSRIAGSAPPVFSGGSIYFTGCRRTTRRTSWPAPPCRADPWSAGETVSDPSPHYPAI